jgi:hypothetical protein
MPISRKLYVLWVWKCVLLSDGAISFSVATILCIFLKNSLNEVDDPYMKNLLDMFWVARP